MLWVQSWNPLHLHSDATLELTSDMLMQDAMIVALDHCPQPMAVLSRSCCFYGQLISEGSNAGEGIMFRNPNAYSTCLERM